MKIILLICVICGLLSVSGCNSTISVNLMSSRCDNVTGTNSVEKLTEGGGQVDAKAALK